jgi:hypothetical protein
MDEQIIFTLFEDPFVTRHALDDPFVIDVAMLLGVGALGTMGAFALAAFLHRQR